MNKTSKSWFLILMGTLLMVAPFPVQGEEAGSEDVVEDIDLLEMKVDTVVTGMRRNQDVKDMPYSVSVITAEDLRQAGISNVPDAFRLVCGVDVASVLYGWETVAPRGFYGSRVDQNLVLIDGRHMYEPVVGGTPWSSWPLQIEDIERIEVIRGSGGVTWGSSATNGVINVVTKDPADQLGVTTRARGGSRGYNEEYVGGAVTDGKLRMRVSGGYEGSDGFLEGPGFLNKLWGRQDNEYKGGSFALKGVYDQSARDSITFGAGSHAMDGLYSISPFMRMAKSNPNSQANYAQVGWHHDIAKDNSFQLNGYFHDFFQDTGMETIKYRFQQFGLDFSNTFKPADNHTLTWGIDSRADYTDAAASEPQFLSKQFVGNGVIGTYVQDEWKFAPKWVLELGGRIDYDFYGGFQPSARTSLGYKPTEQSMIYGAVSRAYLMPPAAGRFADFTMMNKTNHMHAISGMGATTAMEYEIGYRNKFLDNKIETNCAVYWHEYYDAIGTETIYHLPPKMIDMPVTNIGSYSIYGFESEAKYKITKKLSMIGNYTFQEPDWRSPVRFTSAMDLNTPPKHKFMIGPRYDLTDKIHLSGQLFYVSKVKAPNPTFPIFQKHIDEYFRLDLRAEYEFIKNRAWFAVGVQNLLDPAHFEGTSSMESEAQVPRMVYLEVKMTFK
jgi:iron complex outermembrane recepter protein